MQALFNGLQIVCCLSNCTHPGKGINFENQQLAVQLHKTVIIKFKRKVYSSFENSIWGADLADVQLISNHNAETQYLLCVIDVFSKHVWVAPLKDKKGYNYQCIYKNFR